MKKIFAIFSLSILMLLSLNSSAQDKMLTVEDAVLKQRTTLAADRLSQLQWIPNVYKFSFVGKKQGKDILIIQDVQTLKQDSILSLFDFNLAWRNFRSKEKDMTRFPFVTWENANDFRFFYSNAYYKFNLPTMKVSLLAKAPAEAEDLDYDAGSQKLAYTINYNLFVHDGKNPAPIKSSAGDEINKAELLTNDGAYGFSNGKSVHRNEFGITKGTFFSPNATKIAYYKMNEAPVSDYQLMEFGEIDTNHSSLLNPTSFKKIKYPMAGNKSHWVNVIIHDLKKNRSLEVQTDMQSEQYLTNIAWSPDEEYLFIAIVNRGQNEMKLNQYDASTGAFIKTLFTETHSKYVEPEKPMLFLKNDAGKFIWFSEKDGYNHMYLYSRQGQLIKQLTKGKFAIADIIGFDEKGETLFYTAFSEDGMNKLVYSLKLKTLQVNPINRMDGQHSGIISTDGKYVLDTYSNSRIPRRIVLNDASGKEYATLLNALNPLRDYKTCEVRLFSIPSEDPTIKLNCRMILPAQFDSTKKYPVIVYVYGGPHAQMVSNNWLGQADMWLYMMAQQGYITFSLDNRGSMNRGLEFENATHRQLGKLEIEDQLKGVEFLKSKSYVDAKRMGVFGWSFGGFMSTGLMTRTPDVFKVGVAGGPVIDWRLYEIMYTERYMDMPQENEKGYREADLLNYIKNLKGKLLMIHGASDDVVLWQHSLNYIKKSVDEGVLVDYFVYPGHPHNVLGPDRVHLMKKITQYFKENL
jgi:dipeptidyl-peptidase-4